MKKSVALVAMCATALSPVLSTAAYAGSPVNPVIPALADSATESEMQSQCDALIDALNTGDDEYSVTVVPGAVTPFSGPTEVGNKVIDEDTIQPTGDYIPSQTEIRGDPFRIGGSVNMFADQWSTAGKYPGSTYSYTADFTSVFAHAFQCAIDVAVYHPEVDNHVEAVGEYVVNGTFGNSESAVRGNCAAATAKGYPIEDRPDWWGVDEYIIGSDGNPHCRFVGTLEHDETTPAFYDPPVPYQTVDGIPVNQEQTDNLEAFEPNGGEVIVTGEFKIGQVVVCISPSTTSKKGVPGEWRKQNGYTGDKCTTTYMATAPWGSGSTTSNGTFISVPDYQLLFQ